jgi:pyridinium-3,5-bisthiocarboxylic acid mononucleotide nickel chelatase
MAKIVYFDCGSGISGDMVLGALLDAGLPLDELRQALGSLAIRGYEVGARKVLRGGLSATKFHLREHGGHGASPTSHDAADHHAEGTHHAHRSLEEVTRLIGQSALSEPAKARAAGLFRRLAETEAAIHQMPLDQVHLHEVGALDSVIDIVGAVFGMEWLGADDVSASPLNVGGGTVHSEHGILPVPAPATASLLTGVPVYSGSVQAELVTPTGALLVTNYASTYGPLPLMRVQQVGYGAGDHDFPGTPNVLRIFVGHSVSTVTGERVVVLEFEVDDMNPQIFGVLMERLYGAGALEVFYTGVQMKKNRPGVLVTVVAPPGRRGDLSAIVFAETTTIGVRYQEMDRECLDRESVVIATPIGEVHFKLARWGGRIVNAAPEFDDCARLALQREIAVKDVQAIAIKAYLDSR